MTSIPFEPQQTIEGSRTCGAAALTMVYRSLGLACRQLDVWQRVADEIRPAVKATRTHRLALDAVGLGFSSVILQADLPAALLTRLSETGARTILNHRLERQSSLGHYSVLLEFDGRRIVMHDPHGGPNRALPWSEFSQLWRPDAGACEIVGEVLIAIGSPAGRNRTCPECGGRAPTHVGCGRCDRAIPLGPDGVVGCVVPSCPGRLWKRLFCPHCDWAVSQV